MESNLYKRNLLLKFDRERELLSQDVTVKRLVQNDTAFKDARCMIPYIIYPKMDYHFLPIKKRNEFLSTVKRLILFYSRKLIFKKEDQINIVKYLMVLNYNSFFDNEQQIYASYVKYLYTNNCFDTIRLLYRDSIWWNIELNTLAGEFKIHKLFNMSKQNINFLLSNIKYTLVLKLRREFVHRYLSLNMFYYNKYYDIPCILGIVECFNNNTGFERCESLNNYLFNMDHQFNY